MRKVVQRSLARLVAVVTRPRRPAWHFFPSRRRQFESLEERTVLTAGMLDPTFGDGGQVLTDFGFDQTLPTWDFAQAVQADGKIVVAGISDSGFAVARLNPDSSLDSSFDGDGKQYVDFGQGGGYAQAVALQGDGKIVVAGYSYHYANGYDFAVARLNADGSLDTSFDGDGKQTIDLGSFDDLGYGVAWQADGKIVVTGSSRQGATYWDFAAVRLNADGTLDGSFSGDGKQTVDFGSLFDYGRASSLQLDGKLVVVGYSFQSSTGYDFAIARLDTDGTLDTSFDVDGKQTIHFGSTSDYGFGVALQADGKIVVAGQTNQGSNGDFAIARLNASGTLDTSFDVDGKQTIHFGSTSEAGYGVALQADGKIVIAGQTYQGSTGGDFAIARLNASGTLDTSFDSDGKQTVDFGSSGDNGYGVALQPDGKIVIAGTTYNYTTGNDFAVASLSPNGMLDTSFDGDGRLTLNFGRHTNEYAWGSPAALQSDGKIVVAGSSENQFIVTRYLSDGNPDLTFGAGGRVIVDFGFFYAYAAAVAVSPDGKIVVVGAADQGATGYDFAIARLNADGTLDSSFDSDGVQTIDFGLGYDQAYGVALQADGKIVVTGGAQQGATGYDFAVARLNTNGTVDTSFDGDGKQTIDFGSWYDFGYGVAIQPDGKIVMTGEHRSVTGYDFAIARLNPDGTLDSSFDGDGTLAVDLGPTDLSFGVALQQDGKIVVAGYSDNGATGYDFAVVRLNPGGTLDTSFDGDGKTNVDFGSLSEYGYGIALQTDGKIIVAGHSYQAVTGSDLAVARLNADGSLDAAFGTSGKVLTDFSNGNEDSSGILVQPDGKIVVVGGAWGGITRADIALARYIGASNAAPLAMGDSASVREDETVILNVLANDSDPDDDPVAITTFTQPTHGALTLNPDGTFSYTASYCCPAASDSFTYTISDGQGETSTATVTITLDNAAGSSLSGGVLRVWGGSGVDVINVSGGSLIVNTVSHSLTGVSEVRVWGRGGHDVIDLTGLGIKTFVHGGDGNDVLTGGSAEDVIFGGLGDDTVTGGSGHDFLIGGIGKDRLVGSAGNDILVAGDVECRLSVATLRDISAAWSAAQATATTSGDDLLDETFTDSDSDVLTGSSGADLFIINLGDKITDLKFDRPNSNKEGDIVVTV